MSKYLKKFSTVSEYNTYINGSPDLPNVSYITATGDSEVNGVSNEAVGQLPYNGATEFKWKSYVNSVDIPYGYTGIDGFSGCSSLTSVNIPNTVATLGTDAFFGCTSLTNVNIANSVTSIGQNGFYGCTSLTSITIPSSVTSIVRQAFQSCSSLASVTVLATTPPTLGTSAFNNNASGRKIYVPAESVEAYKTATNWSTYAADIEAIPE